MKGLYAELISGLARNYESQTSALNKHAGAINRFGQFTGEHGLTPHVMFLDSGHVQFVAHCPRGNDHTPKLEQLEAAGLTIGELTKPALQFNDGFVIWTAPVTSASLDFQFLFYIPEEVA
jgi:hypothetical protein